MLSKSERLQNLGVIDVTVNVKVFKFVDRQCLK